jgi:hypothetical protein
VVVTEMTPQPGGMSNDRTSLSDFQNKGGFPIEWLRNLEKAGASNGKNYNNFAVVPILDRLIAETGVRPLYLTMAAAPLVEGNRVVGAIVEGKAGRMAIKAKIVIDATGDGDVASRAGADVMIGRTKDGAIQPITNCALILNWGGRRYNVQETKALIDAAVAKAGVNYENPYDRWAGRPMVGAPDLANLGVPHACGYDPLDPEGLSDALIETRRQAVELLDLLVNHVEGFEDMRIGPFSKLPGVRESRRIVTDTIIRKEDAINGARFEDGLFLASQRIDIHRPVRGEPPIVLTDVIPYHIPYSALLPKGLENILVVGRCIGGDHEAAASYRIMANCMAMGEAAALAAKEAIVHDCSLREIAVLKIQREMNARGYQQ